MGINAVADDKIEGNEVLILKLVLTSATQTAINNAGNIFFQDTLNIRVIDLTGNYSYLVLMINTVVTNYWRHFPSRYINHQNSRCAW